MVTQAFLLLPFTPRSRSNSVTLFYVKNWQLNFTVVGKNRDNELKMEKKKMGARRVRESREKQGKIMSGGGMTRRRVLQSRCEFWAPS